MIEIKNTSGEIIYKDEKAKTIKECIIEAGYEGVNLACADLRYADLRNTNLKGVDLQGANLLNANLQYTNFRYANLLNANLREADLRNANLTCVDLRNANLRNANFRYANLQGANLKKIKFNNTIGNSREIKTMQLDKYTVVLFQKYLSIGCETHTVSQWFKFSKKRISQMDTNALKWWLKHKKLIKLYIDINKQRGRK